MRHSSVSTAFAVTLGLVALAACGAGASPTSDESAGPDSTDVTTSSLTSAAFLPDPCSLVSRSTLMESISSIRPIVRNEPVELDGEPLLFRTCTFGDPMDFAAGAVGVQIGVPNAVGHDVVANRSKALDPALDSDIGDGGKETMLLGAMPTGGAKGSTIYFQYRGYSVLIGHIGVNARLRTVERYAREAMAALDDMSTASALAAAERTVREVDAQR